MGYAHIITVYDDGIRSAKTGSVFDPEYLQSVGSGVLKLCLDPAFGEDANGRFQVTWHRVGHMENCLNWIGEVHSSERELFLWAENCLRKAGDLTSDQLREVQSEISGLLESKER